MIFILQALNTCTSNSYKLRVDDLDPEGVLWFH